MPKWEYRTLDTSERPTEPELNALGVEGWELIAVDLSADRIPPYRSYFKRSQATTLRRPKTPAATAEAAATEAVGGLPAVELPSDELLRSGGFPGRGD
jgi:hypothetical protein